MARLQAMTLNTRVGSIQFQVDRKSTRLNSSHLVICYALSQEQYHAAKQAIAANRKVTESVARLQAMTLKEILTKLTAVRRRKEL